MSLIRLELQPIQFGIMEPCWGQPLFPLLHRLIPLIALKESRELLRRALEAEKRENAKESAAVLEALGALREAEFGNSEIARKAASAALVSFPGKDVKALVSLVFARSGDPAHAQALADELNKRFPSDTLLQRYWLPTIRSSIELARNNAPGALAALQGLS